MGQLTNARGSKLGSSQYAARAVKRHLKCLMWNS